MKRYKPELITIAAQDIDRCIKTLNISVYIEHKGLRLIRFTNFTALTVWIDVVEHEHPLTIQPDTTVIIDLNVNAYRNHIVKNTLSYKKLSEDCTAYDPKKELAIIFVYEVDTSL